MIGLVFEPQEKLYEFLNIEVGLPYSSDLRLIGVVKDGKLIACIGYNNWTKTSCFMHVASTDAAWMQRKVLFVAFHYPFIQCGMKKVYGCTPLDRAEALDFNQRVGFKRIFLMKDAHESGAMVLHEMSRGECKWLKLWSLENGQIKRTGSPGLYGHRQGSERSKFVDAANRAGCQSAEYYNALGFNELEPDPTECSESAD